MAHVRINAPLVSPRAPTVAPKTQLKGVKAHRASMCYCLLTKNAKPPCLLGANLAAGLAIDSTRVQMSTMSSLYAVIRHDFHILPSTQATRPGNMQPSTPAPCLPKFLLFIPTRLNDVCPVFARVAQFSCPSSQTQAPSSPALVHAALVGPKPFTPLPLPSLYFLESPDKIRLAHAAASLPAPSPRPPLFTVLPAT